MKRTLAMIALLATTAGCIIVRDGRDVRNTPPGTESCSPNDPACEEEEICEEEQGGIVACDGEADLRFQTFDAPERTQPLTWSWEPDLRTLGGLLVLPTGDLVAQELYFDEPFGSRVVLKRRSDYGPALDAELGVRLEGQLDVVYRDGMIEIWSPDQRTGTLHWSSPSPPLSDLDATFDGQEIWVVGCGTSTVYAQRIDLVRQSASERHELDRQATTCSVLGPGRDARPVLITSGIDAPLERWALHPQDGFSDRLVIAEGVSPSHVQTASIDTKAAFAFVQRDRLYIFNRDGAGDIVGQALTDRFDLAIAPDGAVLAAWADQNDQLFMALGNLPQPLSVFDLGPAPDLDAVSAGINEDEIAVAAQRGPELLFVQGRRAPNSERQGR
ncbi:MAG: hypothetical protein EA397_10310 [Deltaproteobacteria bacterium]|nr:MAG: hypothetical protein EA397_10310 [Deltaproteobacteria bacterium]